MSKARIFVSVLMALLVTATSIQPVFSAGIDEKASRSVPAGQELQTTGGKPGSGTPLVTPQAPARISTPPAPAQSQNMAPVSAQTAEYEPVHLVLGDPPQMPDNAGKPNTESQLHDKIIPDGTNAPSSPNPEKTSRQTSDIQPQAGWSTIMSEDFEGSFPEGSWTVFDDDGATNGEFYWDDDDFMANSGSWSAWAARGGASGIDPEYNYYPNNTLSWMIYGPFSLAEMTEAELDFSYWNQSETDYDFFYWMASTNGSDFYGYRTSGDSGGWISESLDLKAVPTLGDLTGTSSVWISFFFSSDGSNIDDGPFVDDIWLGGTSGEALPDLVPYTPPDWENPVIPSSVTGTTTSSTLYGNQNTYVDWSFVNDGAAITSSFNTCLYLDDVSLNCWTMSSGIQSGYYTWFDDYNMGVRNLSGYHTLRLTTDPDDQIIEKDENNNSWEASFYWNWNPPSQPDLRPYTPDGWDYPLVPSSITGTTTVDVLDPSVTYLDWSVANYGTDTSTTFYNCVYLDDEEIFCSEHAGVQQNYYVWVKDAQYSTYISPGTHNLRLVADAYNNVTEDDENNNSWDYDFEWEDGCPASSYSPPMGGLTGTILADVFPLPPEVQERVNAARKVSAAAGQGTSAPDKFDTSSYLAGSVAVGIILPESSGSMENWTDTEMNCVVSKIQTGMNWWKNRGGSQANLSFVYDVHKAVPTQYEPIDRSDSDVELWMNETMSYMGYSGTDAYDRIYTYTDYLRSTYHTQWAVVYFVADSSNDTDGTFKNSPYFAWTTIGGPAIIMTYDNDGWGIGDMNWVAAHEFGHDFGAGDQYYQAGYGGCTSTTEPYGYLGVANSNCEYNNPNSVPSLMRSNEDALDQTAAGQVGWRDSNGNNIFDVIDTAPSFNLTNHTPDPTSETSWTYTGSVYDQPWPHAVCSSGACNDHDVTINTINTVTYRVDGGGWNAVTAVDGAFNSDFESIRFTTPTLSTGSHTIDVQATTSRGVSRTWSDTVTVQSNCYTLTLNNSPANAGTINANPAPNCNSGTQYTPGTVVTLTAVPNAGNSFSSWSGNASGTSNPTTVTMSASRSVTANYNACYTLSRTSSPTGGGTTSVSPAPNCNGGTQYTSGTVVQITASANAGYNFASWSGDATGTTNPVSVTMSANRSVTANFNTCYSLTTSVNPPGAGSVAVSPAPNCGSGYTAGTVVQLTASAGSGSSFSGWTGDASGTTNPISVTMSANRSVTANFNTCYMLSTSNSPAGSGTVSANPSPNCGSGYLAGTVVQLTANPASNYGFANWSGDVTGTTNPVSVTMSANRSVTANYTSCYTLNTSSNPASGGTVTANPAPNCGNSKYRSGTSVQLTASASQGYAFTSWSGDASGNSNPVTVTVNANRTVTANFTACYALNLTANPAQGGAINANPAPNCSGGLYTSGTAVQLTAAPNQGYFFNAWAGDLTGSANPATINMTANRSVSASFGACYTVAVHDAPAGAAASLQISPAPNCGTGGYRSGTTVTVSTAAANRYQFSGWSGDGSGTSNPLSLQVTRNLDLTANFNRCFALNKSVQPALSGSIASTPAPNCAGGLYLEGTDISLSASPSSGYVFKNWGGDITGTSFQAQVQMDADRSVTGNFDTCVSLTVTANPGSGGSSSVNPAPNCAGGTKYVPNMQVTITANPNAGYTFAGWSGDAAGSQNPLLLTLDSNKSLGMSFVMVPGKPGLISPYNGALVTDYTPLLDWTDSTPSLHHYQVQLADDAEFSAILEDASDLTASSYTAGTLAPNHTYYWRVRAFNSLDQTSGWTDARSFRTALLPPVLQLPEDGDTVSQLNPSFDWLDVDGATGYTLQVSTSSEFATITATASPASSTHTLITDLPYRGRTFFWRVRSNGTNGPSQWSAVWRFTTPNPPSKPALRSPSNGALTTDYTPRLDWGASSFPSGTYFDHYQLQVATDSAFADLTLDENVGGAAAGHEFTLSSDLVPNSIYYWRVRTYNNSGHSGPWSKTYSLRTAMLPPVLLLPVDGESLPNRRPDFAWEPVSTATSYTIQISAYSNFRSVSSSKTVYGTTYTPVSDLAKSKLLYWRVRSNGANGPSAWSEGRQFVTGNPPSIPSLASPSNRALLTDYTPRLDWSNASVPAGTFFDHYQVQVALDSVFTNLVINKSVYGLSTMSEFTPEADLPANTIYYWRVQSFNTDGHYSAWSKVRTFRTALLVPSLVSPVDGELVHSLSPSFDWDNVDGAASYTIQISTRPTIGTPLVSYTTTASSYTMTKVLTANRVYYWRVRTNGTNGPSQWSPVQSFTPVY